MTVEYAQRSHQPVPVGALHRGDQIELYGHRVEVLDLAGHPDFAAASRVLIRRVPRGVPVWTLLNDEQRLAGLHLPRRVAARCAQCRQPSTVELDLALGHPERFVCERCRNPVTSPTMLLPQVPQAPGDGRPLRQANVIRA